MKTYKKLLIISLVLVTFLSFVGQASAIIPILSLSPTGGTDNVLVNVIGDPNSSVVLYTISGLPKFLGNTNNNGLLSVTISTNGYGIVPGGLVYVMVNGQQSSSLAWPNSSSSYYPGTSVLGLNISNLTLPVGSSATISSNNSTGLYVSNNSNTSVASALISSSSSGCAANYLYNIITGQPCFNSINNNNGSVTISALSTGSSNILLCQGTVNTYGNICSTVYVTVTGIYSTTSTYTPSTIVDPNYSTIPIVYSR